MQPINHVYYLNSDDRIEAVRYFIAITQVWPSKKALLIFDASHLMYLHCNETRDQVKPVGQAYQPIAMSLLD